MIYSNNAECGEIFSLQSLFSTVQVEKILVFALMAVAALTASAQNNPTVALKWNF